MSDRNYEDKKAWDKYFWVLNANWEREKALDDFSFNVIKLFVLLNSAAIASILAILVGEPELTIETKNIVQQSFKYWTYGIASAFICYLIWYFYQAIGLFEPNDTYQKMIEEKAQKTTELSKVNCVSKVGKFLLKILILTSGIIVLLSGAATGVFFLLGVHEISSGLL